MKALAQFFVHALDLVEAEGRALLTVVRGEGRHVRTVATNLAMGVTFLMVSVPLFVAGVGLIAAGLMWWLESQVGRPLAASLTGIALLTVGGCCLSFFRLLSRRHPP